MHPLFPAQGSPFTLAVPTAPAPAPAPAADNTLTSSVLAEFFKAHNLSSKLADLLGTFALDLDRDHPNSLDFSSDLASCGITLMDWKRFNAAHKTYSTCNE